MELSEKNLLVLFCLAIIIICLYSVWLCGNNLDLSKVFMKS